MADATQQVTQAWDQLRGGRADQALKQFEATVADHPEDIDAVYGLGLAQLKLKYRDDAIESFNKALSLISQGQGSLVFEEDRQQEHVRTPEEDRFLMLTRMVQQRLEELGVQS